MIEAVTHHAAGFVSSYQLQHKHITSVLKQTISQHRQITTRTLITNKNAF